MLNINIKTITEHSYTWRMLSILHAWYPCMTSSWLRNIIHYLLARLASVDWMIPDLIQWFLNYRTNMAPNMPSEWKYIVLWIYRWTALLNNLIPSTLNIEKNISIIINTSYSSLLVRRKHHKVHVVVGKETWLRWKLKGCKNETTTVWNVRI